MSISRKIIALPIAILISACSGGQSPDTWSMSGVDRTTQDVDIRECVSFAKEDVVRNYNGGGSNAYGALGAKLASNIVSAQQAEKEAYANCMMDKGYVRVVDSTSVDADRSVAD